jgi:hypothetical protein
MQMTKAEPDGDIMIAGEVHYRIEKAADVLGRSPRTVIRYLDDDLLTRVYFDVRRVCIPAQEVHELALTLPPRNDGDRPGGAPRPLPKPGDGPPRGGPR